MHIQILFKKKPEFKDFPLLINASNNRYCLSGYVLPSGRAFVKSLPQAEEICFAFRISKEQLKYWIIKNGEFSYF